MSNLLEKIRLRGYWRVAIHPATFVEKRLSNISDLYPLLQKISVQRGGWDFPYLDSGSPPHIDVDWIGQEPEWEHHLEVWRFYQSGQFVDVAGISEDWLGESKWWPAPAGWKPGVSFNIVDAVFKFTVIFEFAARLSLTDAGDEQMHIEVAVNGINGRSLLDLPGRWPFSQKKMASISELPYKVDLSRTQLIAEPRELALKPVLELFRRFGWEPSMDILRDIQTKSLGLVGV
jgi:hypothetical protein